MLRLTLRRIVARPLGSLLTFLVLFTVGLVGTMLLGIVRAAEAELSGDIGRAWQTPYDLLVRPPGSRTATEDDAGLVRPNFLSGIHGGITIDQLEAIRSVPGVEVAAPIAVVGFVNWPSAYEHALDSIDPGTRVYRVTASASGDGGLSTYPLDERFIVVAPDGRLSIAGRTLGIGTNVVNCNYPTNCFAGTVCSPDGCSADRFPSIADSRYYLPLMQPIVIAGIDPGAEAELAGLDDCVDSGRYLSATDVPRELGDPEEGLEQLPVLASDRSFVDETVSISISTAEDGGLVAGRSQPAELTGWTELATDTVTVRDLYRSYLASIGDYVDVWPVWSAGEVAYDTVGPASERHLAARAMEPDLTIYAKTSSYVEFEVADQLLVPPEARDDWFRAVVEHGDVPEPIPGTAYRAKVWNLVGQYDPTCLAGFDPLAGGRLEAYSFPFVRRLPDGPSLSPSRSMAGYVNSPPLLLTTLDGAAWLSDPARYNGQPGAAFVSVVRVRVSGVGAPGPAAEARLATVAGDIASATGLVVDIVKGASPERVRVDIPAGRFGRPEMTVEEGWSKKGVAIRFSDAVTTQDVVLSGASMASATVLLALASLVSVRRRRREFGILRTLGWSSFRLGALVVLELLTLGVAAAAASTFVANLLGSALGSAFDPRYVPLGLGLTIAVTFGAALLPAWTSGRVRSISGEDPVVRASTPPTSIMQLARVELRRRSWLGALAVVSLAVGVALVGIVTYIGWLFDGRLDTTLLGVHLAARVQPFHVAVALLALVTGAAGVGQIVALGFLERLPQFATLRAIGWPRAHLVRLLAGEAATIWLIGTAIGGAIVAATGVAVGVPPLPLTVSVVLGAVAGAGATAMAVAEPMTEAYRLSPAESLQER